MVLWPTLPQLSAHEREPFFREMVRRYAIIKWYGIGVISVTGVIQWLYLWPLVTNRQAYVFYFGIKMAAAIGLLSITALLAVPDVRLARVQTNRGFWSAMNIACGLTVLIGAALMRTVVKLP